MLFLVLNPKDISPVPAVGTAAVNRNVIKPVLANDLSKFLIIGKSFFSNGPRSLTRDPPDCTILDN